MTFWFALAALAGQGDALPDALVGAVADAYGKSVPRQAICVTLPRLPDGIEAQVQAVGVTQRYAGCRLLGLWVDEAWVSPQDAARVVLGDAVSGDTLASWTQHVMLAFDQVDYAVPVTARSTGSGYAVAATFLQRSDVRGGSLRTEGTFSYDRAGTLIAAERDGGKAFTTRLAQTPYRVQGVSEAVVAGAVKSRGKAIQQCFQEAWESDLSLSGPTRLQWTIAGGKASAVGILAGDDDQVALVRCYTSVLRSMPFPEDATGTVVWSFTADRRAE